MEQKSLKVIGLVVIAGALFYSGYLFGTRQNVVFADDIAGIINMEGTSTTKADFAPFWKAWRLLDENYLPDTATTTKENTDDQKKVWGAIEGMTKSYGDPYTTFFPPKENAVFKTTVSGNFEGVGMELAIKDNLLTVVAPLKNSPAQRAGIKAGDKVIKIDGVDSTSISVEDAVSRIRGPKGTTVVLTIAREKTDKPLEISIVRDVITLPTVDTKTAGAGGTAAANNPEYKNVFVIRLYSFSAVSARLFYDALKQYNESKQDKLVIDLRGNPGGYIDSAVDIASFFIPSGKVVVTESSSRKEDSHDFRSKGYTDFSEKLNKSKIAILVDQGSASASEILAGALSEYGIAKLVGKKTFGKGSVQELFDITDKTSIKITIARWFTPNGRSISHSGITPDIEADITPEDVKAGRDPQLDKAVEYLLSQDK